MLTSVTSAVAVATCSSTLRAAAAGPAAGIGGISIRYTHTSVVTWPSQPRVPIYRSVVVRQQYWYDGETMSSSMMMRPQSSGGQSSHHRTLMTLRYSIIIDNRQIINRERRALLRASRNPKHNSTCSKQAMSMSQSIDIDIDSSARCTGDCEAAHQLFHVSFTRPTLVLVSRVSTQAALFTLHSFSLQP